MLTGIWKFKYFLSNQQSRKEKSPLLLKEKGDFRYHIIFPSLALACMGGEVVLYRTCLKVIKTKFFSQSAKVLNHILSERGKEFCPKRRINKVSFDDNGSSPRLKSNPDTP